MRAEKYFGGKSKEYDERRRRGFLGWIVNRERDAVLGLLNVKAGEKILDMGCGAGYYSFAMKEMKADVLGVDISNEMIEMLEKRGIHGVVGDIQEVNLGKKFDKVLIAGALEFVENPEKAVENVFFHLKKKGVFVLLYPKLSFFGFFYKLYHLSHGVKIKLFSRHDIEKLLNGRFDDIKIISAGINCNAVVAFAKPF